MVKKEKFKPEITRVKLNPEQAVLACSCHNGGYTVFSRTYRFANGIVQCYGARASSAGAYCSGAGGTRVNYSISASAASS